MVLVGPPLLADPPGWSARLPSLTLSPIVSPLAAVLLPNPQVLSSEMSYPPSLIVPTQFPEVLSAKMLLVTVTVPSL
jgi:hypothetical protein